MNSSEVRAKFLEFFAAQNHTIVPSSPLVPGNDATLLFTNAGMVQFKDVFTGREKRAYTRAASSQKCVRAGGKHNDLENVGYTARHHTFFEMLGNFSFGEYFKREAIRYAWTFITSPDWLGLPPARLCVTVYAEDEEAYAIWRDEIGVPEARIVRIGDNKGARYASDNFWSMGDTGPCGPCTEIFYDHDPDGSKGIYGGMPGSAEEDGDRWIEIWNLVFMQYDRARDGSMAALPAPSVDTGMGLERISAVMQGVTDNYAIDLFRHLTAAAARITGVEEGSSASLKVIADHIRAACFLLCDRVLPGNEGRGYVLRRIMRRAIRHGYKLGMSEPFFFRLVEPLAAVMGDAYPELVSQRGALESAIRAEEESFAQTLDKGMRLLDEAISRARGGVIDGATVFKLYDTYGFPVDLTADIARERELTLDLPGYEREMEAQRARARAASRFEGGETLSFSGEATRFEGYERLAQAGSQVLALYRGGEAVDQLGTGEPGVVVLDTTPFYAEGGGQVGDRGALAANDARFEVQDTVKLGGGAFGHQGRLVQGLLRVGDRVAAEVDAGLRAATTRNHSSTHLLHAALRAVLGTHVTQKGSLVDEHKTRFDFSHGAALSADEIQAIERQVNQAVLSNVPVEASLMGFEAAIESGAMALFGEKYGDEVRVLRMGPHSTELCGGTHVSRTGDIGLFKIVAESGVASGIRRVEAITGENALHWVQRLDTALRESASLLRAGRDEVPTKVEAALERTRALEKELSALKARLAAQAGGNLADRVLEVEGVRVLAARLEGLTPDDLRTRLDQLKSQLGSAVIVLGSEQGGRVNLIAGVSRDLTGRFKAGDLVNFVARQVGGKGGGRPDMAQAGGTQPEALDSALASVADWVRSSHNSAAETGP